MKGKKKRRGAALDSFPMRAAGFAVGAAGPLSGAVGALQGRYEAGTAGHAARAEVTLKLSIHVKTHPPCCGAASRCCRGAWSIYPRNQSSTPAGALRGNRFLIVSCVGNGHTHLS